MAYKPGAGISKEALERLRARKQADAGIADVPAEGKNQQWDRLLGEGAKKKLRCGICTRPLSEQEQLDKCLVCAACTASATAAGSPPALPVVATALASEEFGADVFYYCSRFARVARARPAKHAGVAEAVVAEEGDSGKASPSKASSSRPLIVGEGCANISRGAPIHQSCKVRAGRIPIGVLSFNLLADCYIRVQGQPWNAFAFCEDPLLDWEQRLPLIIETLQSSAADIICLQEVMVEERCPPGKKKEEWTWPAWIDKLEGYTCVLQDFTQKEWEKTAQRNERVVGKRVPTGLATLYRTARFEECAGAKHGSGAGITVFLRCRDAAADADAGGGAAAGALELAVGNLHLLGDPSRAAEHLKSLSSLKKNMGKSAVRLACGDFNNECGAGSEVAEWFVQEGFVEAPTGTSWAEPGKAQRLDHIFFSGRLRVEAASGPLTDAEVASGLPCVSCPSDHAPIAVLLSGEAPRSRSPW